MITYAIGDIHGRADLLKRAFSWMEQHIQLLGGQADIGSRPSTWCNFGGGLGSSSCGLCGNV